MIPRRLLDRLPNKAKLLLVFLALYLFLVGIGSMASAFKMMGGGFTKDLLGSDAGPLVSLFIGILATTLVQSSSTTTSLVVGLVAAGAVPFGDLHGDGRQRRHNGDEHDRVAGPHHPLERIQSSVLYFGCTFDLLRHAGLLRGDREYRPTPTRAPRHSGTNAGLRPTGGTQSADRGQGSRCRFCRRRRGLRSAAPPRHQCCGCAGASSFGRPSSGSFR